MALRFVMEPLSQIYSLFSDKSRADKIYTNLLPSLKTVVELKGRTSMEALGLFNILGALPSVGAQRQNFVKHYIRDPDGWKKLPDSPDDIPYGYWH